MTQRATSKRARRGYGRDKRGPPAQKEGRRVTQRATSKRARRGYGRDKRGPPAQEEERRVTQRATFKRARRGYGRDKRGPPAQREGRRDSARDVRTGPAWVRPRQARPSRSGRGEEGFSARRPNGLGVGTAATSAALPTRKKNRDKGVNGEWAAFWRLA